MAKLVTIRFEDSKDADLFLERMEHPDWHLGAIRDDRLDKTGVPNLDVDGLGGTIALGPVSVTSHIEVEDDPEHPYWAEKAADPPQADY